jgi:acyl-CoA synthetase (AMP-forming)/AMP-acid ligase II
MPDHIPSPSDEDLLPTLINTLARESPDTLWAEYPTSPTSYSQGFTVITYARFANAINNCAHFLAETLGRSGTGEPLAWLAPNDPRCAIANVAAMRAGFKVRCFALFPLSRWVFLGLVGGQTDGIFGLAISHLRAE